MNERGFIWISNKMIRVDSIAYVDFLESGRAMIFMRGLTQEKQNIAVDPEDTLRLKAMLEGKAAPEPAAFGAAARFPDNRRWS